MVHAFYYGAFAIAPANTELSQIRNYRKYGIIANAELSQMWNYRHYGIIAITELSQIRNYRGNCLSFSNHEG